MSPGLRLSMKKVNQEERRFCEMRAMSISKGGEAYVCDGKGEALTIFCSLNYTLLKYKVV